MRRISSSKANSVIEGDTALCISIASFWEIVIEQQIKKLDVDETSAQELRQICGELGIEILQTSAKEIDRIRSLPIIRQHGDPFGRLIICQALYRQLPVLTSDARFRLYDVEVVW